MTQKNEGKEAPDRKPPKEKPPKPEEKGQTGPPQDP